MVMKTKTMTPHEVHLLCSSELTVIKCHLRNGLSLAWCILPLGGVQLVGRVSGLPTRDHRTRPGCQNYGHCLGTPGIWTG